jgi:thioredoxin 2
VRELRPDEPGSGRRARNPPVRQLPQAAAMGCRQVAEAAAIPVVVDMWAPWCGPCRAVSPALEQLAQDLAGTVKLVKVNVDEAPKLQQRFTVQAIPTLMVLRDGKVIARQAGATPLPALRDWVQGALAQS